MIERGRRGAALRIAALVVATAAAIAPRSARADPPPAGAAFDEVVLRDGTRLVGHVREQQPGKLVVIETLDGRRRTVHWDAIVEVVVAAPPRATNGGVIGYELRAAAVGTLYPAQEFPTTGLCATGGGLAPASLYGATGSGRGSAAGGAIGARVSYLYESMPRGEVGSSWWALEAGTGLDLGDLYLRSPRGSSPFAGELCAQVPAHSGSPSYDDSALLFARIPLSLGPHVGFGSFRDGATWRGVVLGFAWSPSYLWLKPSNGEGDGSFRWLGFETTVDFATLDTVAEDQSPQPHLRISATFLSPSHDGEPLVVALGLGAAWY